MSVDSSGRRDQLGLTVINRAGYALTFLALLTIFAAWAMVIVGNGETGADKLAATDRALEITQYVFASITPLLAAWVGTVLAFYFGKDNYEAAVRSSIAITRAATGEETLDSVKVIEAMRKVGEIVGYEVANVADFVTVTLDKIDSLLKPPFTRLPIWDSKKILLAFIHRSLLDNYLLGAGNPVPATKTLQDLATQFPVIKDSVVFVAETATLADARRALLSKAGCQDVLVTKSGLASDPVVGWISNERLISRTPSN